MFKYFAQNVDNFFDNGFKRIWKTDLEKKINQFWKSKIKREFRGVRNVITWNERALHNLVEKTKK